MVPTSASSTARSAAMNNKSARRWSLPAALAWMRRSTSTNMGRRFTVLILLFSSIVTLLATALQLELEYRRDRRAIDTQLQQVRTSYADSLAASLWSASMRDLNLQLQGVMRLPDLQFIEVDNEQNAPVASVGTARAPDVVTLDFPLTYVHRERTLAIGRVRVQAPAREGRRHLDTANRLYLFGIAVHSDIVPADGGPPPEKNRRLFRPPVGRPVRRAAAAGAARQPRQCARRTGADGGGAELDAPARQQLLRRPAGKRVALEVRARRPRRRRLGLRRPARHGVLFEALERDARLRRT